MAWDFVGIWILRFGIFHPSIRGSLSVMLPRPGSTSVPSVTFSENSSSMKENHNYLRSEPIGTTRAFSSSVVSAAHEDFCSNQCLFVFAGDVT